MGKTTVSYRNLGLADLDAVVEVDRHSGGVSRRGFMKKRLASQERHPDGFISMAAVTDNDLAGFGFCHMIDGEFGGTERVAVLDAIGVAPDYQGRGLGHTMVDKLIAEVRERGGRELRTQARWNQRGLIDFFSSTGFSLAPRLVLECGSETQVDVRTTHEDQP